MTVKGERQTTRDLRRRCVYCGAYTSRVSSPGMPTTCPGHSDLPALDPHFAPSTRAETVTRVAA